MKPRISVLLSVLSLQLSIGLSQWDDPIRITNGNQDDGQVALSTAGWFWSTPNVEWLAFVRQDSSGRNIYLMKTVPLATSWVDSLYKITADSSWLQGSHPLRSSMFLVAKSELW